MFKKISIITAEIIFLSASFIILGGHFQLLQGSALSIVEEPTVLEFSVTPKTTVPGNSVLVKWKVESSPRGSPITRIRLLASYQTVYDGQDERVDKQCIIPISPSTPAPSDIPIELKIATQDGKVYSKYLSCRLVSLAEIKYSLSLIGVTTLSAEVIGSDTTLNLAIKINNPKDVSLNNIEIRAIETDDPIGRAGPILAYQSGQILNRGINEYRLRITGYHASAGKSVFIVVLYGTTMPKQELKAFPVTLNANP
jgi:hypothetical protein